MKKHLLLSVKAALLCLCVFSTALVANAQGDPGTDDDGFTVRIVSPSGIAKDIPNGFQDCGWVGTADFGPSVTQEFCGDVVWALPDSLGCTPLPAGSLDGKIALIRRGTCGFSLKIYHAQQAGAKAAIILNHYNNALDGGCFAYANATQFFGGMSGLDSASAVTIPAIFLQRQTGEEIDGALKAGEKVEVCFIFPRMTEQTAVYHYSTPLTQVDTIGAGIMSVIFTNRSANTLTNTEVKADIEAPSGAVQSLSVTIPSLDPQAADTVEFDAFIPALEKGKFKVTFSNSVFTESRDSVYTYFEHTDYTFASDNLVVDPLGIGVSNADFINGNFILQNAGLVVTGDAGGNASYVTFGIANADTLWSPLGDDANTIGLIVYDADANEDGIIDLGNSFDDLAGQEVGLGNYIMNGQEPVDSLLNVPVFDTNDPTQPVPLKPNHAYYVSLFYDGANAGTGRCLRFSNTLDVPYAINLTTPLFVNNTLFSGWTGAEVIQRLQMQGFDPLNAKEQKPLDVAKYKITPNPASEYVLIDLKLAEVNKSVTVSLLDWNGRPVRTQTVKEFQNGQLNFKVNDLPSGYYLAWIRTSEGATMAKVAICH